MVTIYPAQDIVMERRDRGDLQWKTRHLWRRLPPSFVMTCSFK